MYKRGLADDGHFVPYFTILNPLRLWFWELSVAADSGGSMPFLAFEFPLA
jgi:hypothetical protein